MKTIRNTVAGLTLGVALTTAWFVGGNLVRDVQFARAEQQVQASRAQISNVQDMASVFKAVGKAVEPSVVNIEVRKTVKNPVRRFHGGDDDLLRRFFRDRNGPDAQPDAPDAPNMPDMPDMPDEFQQQGTGSGTIMETDGSTAYILTNNHVAGGASEMTVTLSDGREIHDAKLVGADPKSDLAVVRIQAEHLIPAKWGDSDKLEKGDIILAFGSPFGYVGSMTHGIVSALNRQAGIISSGFAYENFIQVDAPINPGNSGGPLVDLQGELVGVNTAIASRSGGFQGIGFAIPSNQARFVYDSIKEKGKVVRGWLGVGIKDVSKFPDEAAAQGWKDHTGVIVEQLMNNTPATGKLQPGDIITAINGKKVDTMQELRNMIAKTAPGSEVKLSVFRDNKMQDVSVKLGEQPEDWRTVASAQEGGQRGDNASSSADALGLMLASAWAELAHRYRLDEGVQGAIITSVKPGSAAQLAGLRAGDVVTRVENTNVASPDDFNNALSKRDLKKGIKLYVTNREGTRFAFIKPSEK